jgi:pilus assembly protein CpaC
MTTLPPKAPIFRIFALFATTLLMLAVSVSAYAQAYAQENSINVSFAAPPKEAIPVYVLAGQSVLVVFDESIGRLAVSNSEVAEAVLVAPNQMMINGKLTGRVTFTAWSKDTTSFIFFNVHVRVNLAQLDSQVRVLFPNMDIRLSQASGAVVISGSIPPAIMKQVEEIVKAAGYKTVNLTGRSVENIAQVQLNVKVAEVSRNKLSEFAYTPVYQRAPGQGGYTNTGGGPYSVGSVTAGEIIGTVASSLNVFFMTNNVYSFLRALQNQGALRALAEPNLVAMDGQQASFLAGGEIPVPIVQGNGGGVSLTWKEYGVRLNFKPTILDEQHIRLDIEPEVSSLDFANAVRFEGFLIPALRVRRAKTGIELQNGQTFGIAGLLDNNETKSLSKMPVLADVPILGNLFKSKSFLRNETELVFIVNTKIIKPWNPDEVPQMKGLDKLKNGSPLGMSPAEVEFRDRKKTGDDDDKDAKDAKSEEHGEAKESKGDAHKVEPQAAPAEAAPEGHQTVAPAEQISVPETAKPVEPAAPVETAKPPVHDAAAEPPVQGAEHGKEADKDHGKDSAHPPTAKEHEPAGEKGSGVNPAPKEGEHGSETPPHPQPAKPTAKPALDRAARPEQAVQALHWKLKIPATATVTAQTRP